MSDRPPLARKRRAILRPGSLPTMLLVTRRASRAVFGFFPARLLSALLLVLAALPVRSAAAAPARVEQDLNPAVFHLSPVPLLVPPDLAQPVRTLALVPAADRRMGLSASATPLVVGTRRLARPAPLVPLYASFVALQAGDIATTLIALGRGAREANPVLGGIAGHPATLIGAKAGVTVASLYLSERLWKRNRTAALVMMLALNVGYGVVLAHNARVIGDLR